MRTRPQPVLIVHRVPRGRPLAPADHRLVQAVVHSILETKRNVASAAREATPAAPQEPSAGADATESDE